MTMPLTRTALLPLCLSVFLSGAAQSEERVHFNEIDADGDHLITPEEMTNWRLKKFSSRDLNDDGLITRAELMEEARDGERPMSWEEASQFIIIYNTNSDLMVSYQEVSDAIEGSYFFSIIDQDGSRNITPMEADGWLDITDLQAQPNPEIPDWLNPDDWMSSDPMPGTLY